MNYYQNKNEENSQASEDIDFNFLVRIFLRNKFPILFTSFLISFLAAIFSLIQKPIWRGNFTVFVNDDSSQSFSNNSNPIINVIKDQKNLINEQFILKSPFVLKSVFEYVKASKNIEKTDNYTFNEWIQGPINVEISKGSAIIKVSYEDEDKEFILDVLNKISNEYKKYSISEVNKDLDQQIKFLSAQEIVYKKKFLDSLKTFNNFSIKNGLGDIDGFVNLGRSQTISRNNSLKQINNNNQSQLNIQSSTNAKNSAAGQRFARQFALLETLETEYINYSSLMKKDSKYLINLKSKIENLKSSLKRPNEILVKYRELENILERNELIYNNIEDNLISLKIERAKDKKTWDIISEPTLDKYRISPQRKKNVLIMFVISFFGSFIFSIYKERKSDCIFEISEFKKLLNTDFKETFEKNEYSFNNSYLTELRIKNDFAILKGSKSMNQINFENFIDSNLIKEKLKTCQEANFKDKKKFLIFIEEGKVTKNDIKILNKYENLYPESFCGWIYLKT